MKFKPFLAATVAATACGTGLVHAQGGHMMEGGGWFGGGMGGWMGRQGGLWVPVLLVLIIGLLVWFVMQRRK